MDLLEQYESRRSATRLWWQALRILAATVIDDLRQHKLLALRAVVTGAFVILSASALKNRIAMRSWSDGPAAFWILTLLSFLLAGWVVGATHRHRKAAMVAAFMLYAALAKVWVYTTHFHHYWNLASPHRFFSDISLTAIGLGLIAVGGLLSMSPATRVQELARN